MAKTRMLKHDLRTSEKVASWPIPIRYFWALLWGYVDDHGKGKDNPLLVKSDCFPLDVEITGDTINEWLWHLADEEVLARYTVAGTEYLQVVNWKEHQKPPHPTPDVLPGFTDENAVIRTVHEHFMHDAGNPQEPLTPVLGLGLVKSGSGFVNEWSPAATAKVFDDAYSHWPKKVKREEALQRFITASKQNHIDPNELAAHVIRFGEAYAATTAKQYIPALGVWLNGRRWTDELPTPPRANKPTRTEENLSVVAEFARRENSRLEIQS